MMNLSSVDGQNPGTCGQSLLRMQLSVLFRAASEEHVLSIPLFSKYRLVSIGIILAQSLAKCIGLTDQG